MDPIRSAPSLTGLAPAASMPRPPAPAARSEPVQPLEPAVMVERAPPAVAEQRGYERDAQTRGLVFRITDPVSGQVVLELPDATVLKARAYARQAEAAAGARVETLA